jgi:NAD(P)-dependent dehydrogenase (short-subunit alcohol dehydrogenase family)
MTSALTLITGASSGIGSAIARRLSGSRRLVLHGRDMERLTSVRDSCAEPGAHVLWACDFSDVAAIGPSLRESLDGSRIDAFVHSAGRLVLRAFRATDEAAGSELFQVNFFSAAEILRLLVNKAVNAGALRAVVFITSGASIVGEKGNAMYAASKGALDAFMKSAAIELAPGVRVNSILPGIVRTPMSEAMMNRSGMDAAIRNNYPLGEGLTTDVAAATEFLLSDNARWITGQQLAVDGGYTAHANRMS